MNLKSLLLNNEKQYFNHKSGEILDDALESANKNLLLYKKNKVLSAKNNRKLTEDPHYEIEPLLKMTEMDGSTFLPKHCVYKGHCNTLILVVPRQSLSYFIFLIKIMRPFPQARKME